MLKWKTTVEFNTDYFTVQRSGDGVKLEDLAQVISKSSHITSDYQLNYSCADQGPLPGTSFYRLLITVKEGKTSHSDILQLSNARTEEIRILPTVVQKGYIVVQSEKAIWKAKLEVYDLSGKKMSERNWGALSGGQSVSIQSNSYMAIGPTWRG